MFPGPLLRGRLFPAVPGTGKGQSLAETDGLVTVLPASGDLSPCCVPGRGRARVRAGVLSQVHTPGWGAVPARCPGAPATADAGVIAGWQVCWRGFAG